MPKKPEAQTTEYKSSWHDDYFEWISGYANVKGGTLYIGVNDDGYVVGVKDTRFLLDQLPNKINSYLGITVSIDHGTVAGLGENIKYGGSIPDDIATKPVNLYARKILTEQALNDIDSDPGNFLYDKVGMKWDAVPVKDVVIDHEALDFLREHALEKNRLTQKAVAVSDETLIKNLKILTNDGEYTRAAAMLFGNPEDVVFGAYIRIGFFENGRLKYQDEIHGPLISQAHRAADMMIVLCRCNGHLGTRFHAYQGRVSEDGSAIA